MNWSFYRKTLTNEIKVFTVFLSSISDVWVTVIGKVLQTPRKTSNSIESTPLRACRMRQHRFKRYSYHILLPHRNFHFRNGAIKCSCSLTEFLLISYLISKSNEPEFSYWKMWYHDYRAMFKLHAQETQITVACSSSHSS